jgi:3-oxoacyl-[acyl-carrier protein] reductase
MSTDTFLLTGASSDLAAELIRRLLRAHPDVRILAMYNTNRDRLDRLKEECEGSIIPIACDLSNLDHVVEVVQHIRSSYGVPTRVVHLAASRIFLERFPKWDRKHFEKDMRIQVGAIAEILRVFLPAMAKSRDRSKVVFVLSSFIHGVPPKFTAMYTVVKYATLGLMRMLAAEYAGSAVNINAISPSTIETQFLSEIPKIALEMVASKAPSGRHLSVGEVVDVLEFLLSHGSDHMMGVDVPVTDGGSV